MLMTLRRLRRLALAPALLLAASCENSVSIEADVLAGNYTATSFLVTQTGGGVSLVAVRDIALQLLAPFVAGQLSRKWIGRFVARHKQMLGYVDRGSILLVVYAAFSEGVVAGIWSRLSIPSLLSLFLANAAILAAVLGSTMWVAHRLRFSTEDQIAIVFCGSKKSLASGLPLASVLLPTAIAGLMVVPLMMFHQMQLMACAWLARRYAARSNTAVAQPV